MIPAPAAAVCAAFLGAAPAGLVTGLYLRGGIGFGEWVDGQSDVDFVATLDHRPSAADVAGLRAAHEAVAAAYPDVSFDGCHVLVQDLAGDPRACPDVPCILNGAFAVGPVHDAVVAWHELAWQGVTVVGPAHDGLGIWTSQELLLDFTRGNLDTYWRSTAEALGKALAGGDGRPEACSEEACTWCVLGVARLHHLLVTGAMTTKSRAGRWGLDYYPDRFRPVLEEALRVRDGGPERYAGRSDSRGADTVAFTAYVVAQGTG